MRHLLLAGVMVLTSSATSTAQIQALAFTGEPVNVTFVNAQMGDALALIAKFGGITIEFDATVTEEVRKAPLSQETIRMVNATLEDALALLTSQNGLTYTIIGPKAVRISKKV